VLELMIPPHYWLGSTVVVCPSRFGVVPGSIPSLAILFSSYTVAMPREGELRRGDKRSGGQSARLGAMEWGICETL
jgi:hypothetical protein